VPARDVFHSSVTYITSWISSAFGNSTPMPTPMTLDGSGAYAKFSSILADFESIAFRGRKESVKTMTMKVETTETKFVSAAGTAEARNKLVWGLLANFLLNYAKDNYEDFEGETVSDRDEVAIFTVHQSKGLEWPVVFLPSLTSRRFPSSMSGRSQPWLIPDAVFGADKRARYEGSDADERRLFYVAVTRARDTVYLSYAQKKTNKLSPSPYLQEVANSKTIAVRTSLPPPPPPEHSGTKHNPVEVSFSDLADHEHCGHVYRLSRVFGFQREVAEELGYGKAVHHVMRTLAERRRTTGKTPTLDEIHRMVESELFVPFANRASYEQMEQRVKTLVQTYVKSHGTELERVWATERPFEIRFANGILSGRADVILDKESGSGWETRHRGLQGERRCGAGRPLRDAAPGLRCGRPWRGPRCGRPLPARTPRRQTRLRPAREV